MPDNRPVALITGGAKRLGREISKNLADAGFRVAIHYNGSEEAARQLRNEINGGANDSTAIAFRADLSNVAERQELSSAVIDSFRRVDLLVNNASIYRATELKLFDAKSLKPFMDVHLAAVLDLSLFLVDKLKANDCPGRIINVSDVHAGFSRKGYGAYLVSKAAQESLTRQLAVELAPDILVNGVAPGAILDPIGINDTATREAIIKRIALKRFGTPGDIAKTVLFLASAEYITGQVIRVDGGWSLSI